VRRNQGFAGLVEGGHGFEDQEVNTGAGEGVNLLRKGCACFVETGFAQWLKTHAERADGAGYPCFTGLLVFEVLNGLAGKLDAGHIDLRDLPSHSVAGKAEAVGAKGVGFKKFRAGLQVFLVDGEDESGIRDVQLVVTAVDEDTARIEHCTHGAVGEYGTGSEDVSERRHRSLMLNEAALACQPGGLLCYTSVVISWVPTGSGIQGFLACESVRQPSSIRLRCGRGRGHSCGSFRAFRRGKGF
jgi:hypothetical protein